MEEEFVPKKLDSEKKEEIKEEVQNEVKEEVHEVIKEEPVKEIKNDDKKEKVKSIISRTIWGLITLIVIGEIILGVLNTQKMNEDKEPIWCFEYKTEKVNNKEETTCHLGLYVIVKTNEGNKKETSLKPFFLK